MHTIRLTSAKELLRAGPLPRLACIMWSLLAMMAVSDAAPLAPAPWPATDGLGRSLPMHDKIAPLKTDRYVGMFYFIWLGAHSKNGPFDITEIETGKQEFGPPGAFHHWGKPELDYYYSSDPFVIRRHAQQLCDAGVDFIALDVTNAFTYNETVDVLCKTWLAMRAEGNRTPQIVFLTNSNHQGVAEKLYQRIYKAGLYRDLWFMWDGKPLLMSNPEGLSDEVTGFFTLRHSWAWSKDKWWGDGRNKWPWLDHWPQKPGLDGKGKPEQISVSVAQHPTSNIGRSHFNKQQPAPADFRSNEGVQFQQQWDRALEVDPKIVFVTGWNEWVAQRFVKEAGKPPGDMLGRKLSPGENYFVDAYNLEYSRDIEPMSGGYEDAYYYQLVANVRRFKGMSRIPQAAPSVIFKDDINDNAHRDHEGWGKRRLTDTNGRNDIVSTTATFAGKGVVIRIQTKGPLLPSADETWMNMFIDLDRNPKTGWNGFDCVVNRTRTADGKTSVEELLRDGSTRPILNVAMKTGSNFIEIQLTGLPEMFDFNKGFDFHISDKAGLGPDFYQRGDHAPNRRFNYRLLKP